MATPLGNSDTADVTLALDACAEAGSINVLLVAADPHALESCAERLRAGGMRTATARTGFEAIVKACWHLPDLIVMQQDLLAGQGVDGSVATQMIRVCPATAHIPIVDAGTLDRLQSSGIASREFSLLADVARELSRL